MPFVPSRRKRPSFSLGSPDRPESVDHTPEGSPLSLSFLRRPSRSGSMGSDGDTERILKENTRRNSVGNIEALVDPPLPSPAYSDGSVSPTHTLVRKKSGELVKSSLKLNRLGSSKSLPSTPIDKQVHFGGSIDVKYFKKRDKPTSISAGNSPYNSDEDEEDPERAERRARAADASSDSSDSGDVSDSNDDTVDSSFLFSHSVSHLLRSARDCVARPSQDNLKRFKGCVAAWTLDTSSFPKVSYRDEIDREVPVFLETMFLRRGKTAVAGKIAVKNIDYSKNVTVRYTCDGWVTVVNIEAQYTANCPRLLKKSGYDRFTFEISLATMLSQYLSTHRRPTASHRPEFACCIQYVTGGQEFWDNNFNRNYVVKLAPSVNNIPLPTELKKSRSYQKGAQSEASQVASVPHKPASNASSAYPVYTESPLSDSLSAPPFANYSPFTNSGPSINSPGTPAVLKGTPRTGIKDNFNTSPRSVAQETENQLSTLTLDQAQDTSKPAVGSDSYQALLKKYCFFQSPSTVSSFLNDENDQNDVHEMEGFL